MVSLTSAAQRPADKPYISANSVRSAEVIVPIVLRYAPAERVIDLGCKHGEWLRAFVDHGVASIFGIDRRDRPEHLVIDPECFRSADLSAPIDVAGAYDLAVCVEVAEHLPPSAAAPLVHTLARVAPVVLFSAAVPDQGGHGHLNERPREYWKSLFAAEDYLCLDCIRPWIWQDARVAWWYRQNLFLYASRQAIERSDVLRREAERPVADDVDLIHTDIVRRRASLRSCLREWSHRRPHILSRS